MGASMPALPVTVVVGTRPEVLKMAPVLRAMAASRAFDVDLCAVGQHAELLDRAFADCDLRPTVHLALPGAEAGLGASLGATVKAVAERLREHPGAAVIVQGDTTTTLGGALAGFYAGIPVAHVEAGLRSGDDANPFPEEVHRALVDRVSTVLYAPTAQARENLLREGVEAARIEVVGNTSIDALRALRPEEAPRRDEGAPRRVLVTCHRRENFGDGVREVCASVAQLVAARDDVEVDFVLHSQPSAHLPPREALAGLARVRMHEPMPHRDFVALLNRADVVLTDSGGVQEEAAYLGRPLLVLRARTERVEAVRLGAARVVGTSPRTVLPALYECLAAAATSLRPVEDYGDGTAGERIAADLAARLGRAR